MTIQVIAELDQILALLEAQIPANPSSPKNRNLARKLEQELARYFKALEDAFPFDQLDRLYYKFLKESLGEETRDILDPLLAALDEIITVRINGHLTNIYISATAEMITWGKTKGGIPIAYEGPPISEAIEWAQKQGAKLVTQMNTETKRRLAQSVSDGIKNKRGIPGLSRDIRKSFTDMSKYRSRMIARTETANALSQASLDRMKDMDIEGKEWIWPGGDCDICADNQADGVIPVNQAFSSGEMNPPAHPNCMCAIAPARLSR